jgi:response regulator RpfG family c-di-GMP phosphodiesterase
MENYDYKKFAILYVDDEEKSLKNFTRAFGDEFRVMTADQRPGRPQAAENTPTKSACC